MTMTISAFWLTVSWVRHSGRYRIVKELGRGSMGIVYLGEAPTIHRSVAIKTMGWISRIDGSPQ